MAEYNRSPNQNLFPLCWKSGRHKNTKDYKGRRLRRLYDQSLTSTALKIIAHFKSRRKKYLIAQYKLTADEMEVKGIVGAAVSIQVPGNRSNLIVSDSRFDVTLGMLRQKENDVQVEYIRRIQSLPP